MDISIFSSNYLNVFAIYLKGRNFLRKKFFAEEIFCGRNFLRKKFFAEEIFCGRNFLRKKFFAEEIFCGRNFLRRKFFAEEIFCGGNFLRKKFFAEEIFAEFIFANLTPIRKNFFRKIFPILVNRKNFFRKIFQNWSIAKISSAKNPQFFYDDLQPNYHNIQILSKRK